MNKKVFLITSALLLWVITMSAQTYDLPNYIVYKKGYISLKNGDILKGKYVYSVDFKKLKVIANNETRIFDADDVGRITKKNPFELADTSNGFIPSTYKPSRIFNITELGFLMVIRIIPTNRRLSSILRPTTHSLRCFRRAWVPAWNCTVKPTCR